MKMSEGFKMKEVFNLPLKGLAVGDFSKLRESCIANAKDEIIARSLDGAKEATVICQAVNSHDTHLSHIQLLLDRLKPFANAHEGSEVKRHYTPQAEDEDISNLRAVEHSAIITMGDLALAHQAVTELREKYPKEEKRLEQKRCL